LGDPDWERHLPSGCDRHPVPGRDEPPNVWMSGTTNER